MPHLQVACRRVHSRWLSEPPAVHMQDAWAVVMFRIAADEGDGHEPRSPRRGVPSQPQGPGRRDPGRGPLPAPVRPDRPRGPDHPAPGRPPPPSQGRRGLRPPTGPCHRRRAGGHGRRPRHRRGPVQPPHRARSKVLAQPTTRPRPMAGSQAIGWPHVPPMPRLVTFGPPGGIRARSANLRDRGCGRFGRDAACGLAPTQRHRYCRSR